VITIAQNFRYGDSASKNGRIAGIIGIHFAGVRLVRRSGIGLVTGVSRS
jgi:hypothetical protein